MTGNQLLERFGIKYGDEISPDVPGLEVSEVLLLLNQAKDDVIEELYKGKAYEHLSNITETQALNIQTSPSITPNSVVFTTADLYQSTFLYYLDSRVQIQKTYPVAPLAWVPTDPITIIEDNFIETSYHKPMFEKPKVMQVQSYDVTGFQVIVDAYTVMPVGGFTLIYIRPAADIVATSTEYEMNLAVQKMIVSRAVTLALEILKSSRVQTQPVIDK